jgi:hypothetical protein
MSLLTIDASTTKSQIANTGTVTTSAFSTNYTNEVLYALCMSDGSANISTVSVTGAGLTWTKQASYADTTLAQGAFYVFTAFSAAKLASQTVTATDSGNITADMSIVVLSFQNADNITFIGASGHSENNAGVATVTMNSTRNNSQFWAIYYDTTANTSPTLAAGLTKYFDVADTNDSGRQTYIQKTAPVGIAGTSVTINTTAPTADATAMFAFEILPSFPSIPPPIGSYVYGRNLRPYPFSPGLAR